MTVQRVSQEDWQMEHASANKPQDQMSQVVYQFSCGQ